MHFLSTNCEINAPKSVRVVSLVEGIFYHQQTVDDGLNLIVLQLVEIRKKWELSVQLNDGDESSLSAPFYVCEFITE